MSRGPGRIERAIERIMLADPDFAFSISHLCWLVYPAAETIERKHRIAVLRALPKVIERNPSWMTQSFLRRRGAPVVLFNRASIHSVACRTAMVSSFNLLSSKYRAVFLGRREKLRERTEKCLERFRPQIAALQFRLQIAGTGEERQLDLI